MNAQGMIFAAGYGTRLLPLTRERPKPALPVANRAMLEFAVEALADVGIIDVRINCHHLPEVISDVVRNLSIPHVNTHVFFEPMLLGTAGGVHNTFLEERDTMDGDIVAMNADTLFSPDLHSAIDLHRKTSAWATLVLRTNPDPTRYTPVHMSDDMILNIGSITSISKMPMLFTGVQILTPSAVSALPKQGCIIRDGIVKWLEQGHRISAFIDESPWYDLGTPRDYLNVNLALASGRTQWPNITPQSGSIIHPSAQVHPSAMLENVIVGADVTIEKDVALKRTVVWDHTRVQASYTHAVITPQRVVCL